MFCFLFNFKGVSEAKSNVFREAKLLLRLLIPPFLFAF